MYGYTKSLAIEIWFSLIFKILKKKTVFEISVLFQSSGLFHCSGVLDTWLQYANDESILKIPNIDLFQPKISVDAILELSMKMSDKLIEVYKLVEGEVNEYKVKEIFNNLADMQMQKQKRISMNFDRLMDI